MRRTLGFQGQAWVCWPLVFPVATWPMDILVCRLLLVDSIHTANHLLIFSLVLCNFESCIHCRMWEFSVGLYMIDVWPDSLFLAAAYGVVESASTALFGPLVGQLVDKLTYLKVRTSHLHLIIFWRKY